MRDHGGNLDEAQARWGQGDWIDLSTGINRQPYPVSRLSPGAWTNLPTASATGALMEAAATAFGTAAPGLALAGAQAAIQMIPLLEKPGLARVLAPTYNEHAACLRQAGWHVEEVARLEDLSGADLAVVVNPNNTWVTTLTIDDLKKMWEPAAQGKVTMWNQVRPEWPAARLMLFGPGADSGTFDYFTEAVAHKAKASRGDYTASEDDNVLVQGVEHNRNALGYFGFAYYISHTERMRAVAIEKPDGTSTEPSVATVMGGTYQPLSRPLFVYVSRKAADRHDVQQFVGMFFTRTDLVREVGYIELTKEIYDLARSHFADRRTGTAFEKGNQVGMTLEALLARER